MTTSVWARSGVTKAAKKHVVLAVHFEKGIPDDDAPIDCTCGWAGIVADYAGHSKQDKVIVVVPATPKPRCSTPGCPNDSRANGLCHSHETRQRRGKPVAATPLGGPRGRHKPK